MSDANEYSKKLSQGKCPKCNEMMTKYMPFEEQRVPRCLKCDSYWTTSNGVVMEHTDAEIEALEYYEAILQQNREILEGNY